jgi:SAM-dependent methyltransferase
MLTLDRQERFRQRYKAIKPGYRPALEVYKAWADELVTEETLLLDVGCGEANLVDDYVGKAKVVVGIDRYIQPIRETIEIDSVVEGDIAVLPFASESFSLVTCSWVLEHLERPERVFAAVARVLKPGGCFLFITPNHHHFLIRARQFVPNRISTTVVDAMYGRGEDYIFQTHYRANSRAAIDEKLLPLGFENVQFAYVSDPSYLAFNRSLFWLSVLVERAIDRFWPTGKVHLVGCYRKLEQPGDANSAPGGIV